MSKLILFEFKCTKCGREFDDLVKSYVHNLPCVSCGGKAKRQVSAGHLDYRMGVESSSFPTMADKWARMQTQKAKSDKGSLSDGAPNLKMY